MRPRLITTWFVVLGGLLALGLVYRGAGLAVCLGVSLYALRGTKESVQSLFVLAFLIMISKLDVSMGRWAILAASFGRVAWDGLLGGGGTPSVLKPILLFAIAAFGGSLVVSAFPLVSILKLATFAVGTSAVLVGLYRTRHLTPYWLSFLSTMGFFILVVSIPFYFHPLGFERNGVGFQGITNHPQTFGPVLAPLTALFTGLYLFHPERQGRWIGVAAALGWVGMYLSLSRTSMLAAVLGLMAAVGIGYLFKSSTWGQKIGRALGNPAVLLAGIVMLALTAVQWSTIQQQVDEFLFKDDETASVVSALQRSRSGLANESMANFWESPVVGIGFGAPSDPERFDRQLERGPLGIPISASVEKGFMPSAVLEETGIVGAVLVLVILGGLFAPIVRHGDIVAFWVLATALLVNLGEMIFFTMGGNGLYLWIVMGFCYCWSAARAQMRPPPRAPQRRVHPRHRVAQP